MSGRPYIRCWRSVTTGNASRCSRKNSEQTQYAATRYARTSSTQSKKPRPPAPRQPQPTGKPKNSARSHPEKPPHSSRRNGRRNSFLVNHRISRSTRQFPEALPRPRAFGAERRPSRRKEAHSRPLALDSHYKGLNTDQPRAMQG